MLSCASLSALDAAEMAIAKLTAKLCQALLAALQNG